MKVSVFGTGYVGLVQGAVLAEVGHEVICVDVDKDKINKLNIGVLPIYEAGLQSLVERNCSAGRLRFSSDAEEAVAHGDILFIAVGTPSDEDGSADLKYVIEVSRVIGGYLEKYTVVVNKSTVPIGTADKVQAEIASSLASRGRDDVSFDVVSNPEFLKEGAAVNDCMRPDRIIIGLLSDRAERAMRKLYEPFNRNHEKIIVMDPRSAELTKYAANCLLATKISFMNEMAEISERVGADIEKVRQGIGSDPRIGYHFIYAGAGYGGSCFPKDIRALLHTASANDVEAEIISSVNRRNNKQKKVLFNKLSAHFNARLNGLTVAVWGLSFKPNTDDIREAPSRDFIEALWEAGCIVRAYDPVAMPEFKRIYGERSDLELCSSKEEALCGADTLAIMTEWQMFKVLDVDEVKRHLVDPVIFDGRNLFDPEQLRSDGIVYYSFGR